MSAKLDGTLRIAGYEISEELYSGSRTLVYRAVREGDRQPVVIKLLKREYPTFSELVQFRNQYAIAKNLDIPGIIKPYSLEAYHNGYALVMEDFGGISLRQFTRGKPLTLEQFLPIALQLLDTLHQFHQQCVIHKDIKPANILIHPDTKQVKLIDFSIASLLPRETQEIQSINSLEGTLAYLSPEQTGRMNRGIDYRSDFYSLGVTFFELLSGKLPFESHQPMELVHCHIAKQPPLVCDFNPDLPLMLGEIVGKLMAKNAEDRYQSALGLKHDLVTCLEQWRETGKHTWFELGQRDISDRFLIREKLYGRESQVQTLLEAFGYVANGGSQLMLVAGFSGIGKTAVVNEVHKPIVRWNGYFIKGKYDQFNRNIPLSAFVQAFRDLIGQLLSESDTQFKEWQSKILAAVGENGQLLIEVIPELEQIIGKQPAFAPDVGKAIAELSASAAQNRFNLLFQKFIQVFTTIEHPLVMFLDDLQWADSASLNLLKLLMTQNDSGYLLIIGAYRDNEMFATHPLMLTVDEIEKASSHIKTLTLAPLSQVDVNHLIADSLNCTTEQAFPLTELVYQKTKGNPFFTTQFLKALHEDGLITFDPPQSLLKGGRPGGWQCNVTQIKALALTDDVLEFMTQQLQKLPSNTQDVLKLAACIGNQFDLGTLAIASENLPTETASDLWKALQEGLIIPTNEIYKFYQDSSLTISHLQRTSTSTTAPSSEVEMLITSDKAQSLSAGNRRSELCNRGQMTVYRFLHDRVQQAAYSLIPDDQKQATHLKIGQLLLQKTSLNNAGEKLFDIVNHLNIGQSLISQPSQRHQLAQLNLTAGRKARAATAYSAAIAYLTTGIDLLCGDRWQHEYNLSLALYEEATEAAYLNTDFEQMEQLAETVLTHTHSWLERVTTYQAKIQACIAQNQHLEALRLAREILNQLGVYLPEQPTQLEIKQGLQHTQTLLDRRSIESLLDLPQMTAPEQKAAMTIISNIMSAAYQVAPNLLPLLTFVQVDLSVEYGNTTESTYGYVMYGLMLVVMLKDIDAGYRFGQLGMNLLQRMDAPKLAAKTIFGFNNSLRHWQEPAKDTLTGYLQAYATGLETGDLEYVALSLMCYSYTAYFSGVQLSALKQTMDEHRKVIQEFRQDGYFRIQSIYYQAVLNLLEPTAQPDRLCSKDYDEDQMIQLHLQANQLLALYQIYFNKLILSYLFHRYEQALLNARLTEKYLGAAVGLMHIPLFSFYDALLQLAIYPTASQTEQAAILDQVCAHQEKLQEWASYAPSNQAHRWALVAAERCRVLGEKAEAIDLYDRAISLAKENGYIQEEALANELATRFYLDWGKQRIAQSYITKSYYGYARWGAKAKVADLERRYPRLLAPILEQTVSPLSIDETLLPLESLTSQNFASSNSSSVSVALDLATILKASQTLSGEIELEKLLSALLHIVIENAGADKCVFMLFESDRLLVQALAQVSLSFVKNQPTKVDFYPMLLNPQPVEDSIDVPVALINTVKRSLQPAVIIDATVQLQLINDPYIQQQQPKSILCSPILHQGKLLGILYLENNLVTGAFTSDRVQLLNLLCAQAAISLENARLYAQEQEKSQSLQASLAQLKQSESRAQQLFEQSTDPLCLFSCRVGFIDCNQSLLNLFGYVSKEQFLSLHPWQISPKFQPDGQRSFTKAEIILRDALYKSSNQFEWMHQRANGENFWAEITQTMIPYKGETIFHTVIRDISERKAALYERKQAEASLAKKQEFLNAIIHNITDGIIVCDLSGQLTLFNKATCEIHGLPLESLLPEQWAEHFDLYQSDGQTLLSTTEIPLFRALQGEIVENAEIVIAPKHGYRRILLASGQAILDSSGNKLGAVIVMRDISDRKQSELALQQKSHHLEQVLTDLQNAQLKIVQSEKMSALGNLVAGIAHEMNNPLGFISASLKQAKPTIADIVKHLKLYQQSLPNASDEIKDHAEEMDLDYSLEDLPKIIDSMTMACDRLKNISTSLRTFSRADKDYKVPFNIHQGIDSTILILKHRLKANEQRPAIEVITEYGYLPEVECFCGQLNQVFMNILANAIDALDESNKNRSFQEIQINPNLIKIKTSVENECVKITITDNGKGMSEEVKQKIFDHLFTTKPVGKGTGLGLAIARQIIVEKHGGAIAVDSTLGQGTEFTIQLPI